MLFVDICIFDLYEVWVGIFIHSHLCIHLRSAGMVAFYLTRGSLVVDETLLFFIHVCSLRIAVRCCKSWDTSQMGGFFFYFCIIFFILFITPLSSSFSFSFPHTFPLVRLYFYFIGNIFVLIVKKLLAVIARRIAALKEQNSNKGSRKGRKESTRGSGGSCAKKKKNRKFKIVKPRLLCRYFPVFV